MSRPAAVRSLGCMTDTATRGPDTAAPPARHGSALLGVLLLVAGAAWFMRVSGLWLIPTEGLLAGLLILVGLLTVWSARPGQRGAWPLLIGAGLIVALISTSASHRVNWDRWGGPIGDQSAFPTSAGDLLPTYRAGAGRLLLDLRQLSLQSDDTATHASEIDVTAGQVTVVVPPGMAYRVTARASFGTVRLPDNPGARHVEGPRVYTSPAFRPGAAGVDLTINVTFGTINVREAAAGAPINVWQPGPR